MIKRINVFAGGRIELIRKNQYEKMQKVYDAIKHYYDNLYKTRPCYKYPLNLYRITKLTKFEGRTVASACKLLETTIPEYANKDYTKPLIRIEQKQCRKNKSHITWQIYLNEQ